MKRVMMMAMLLALVIQAFCGNAWAVAKHTDYAIEGIELGDDVDGVTGLLGCGEMETDEEGITTILYKNRNLGSDVATYKLSFDEDGLYEILLEVFIKRAGEKGIRSSLEKAYGKHARTDQENVIMGTTEEIDDGEIYMWALPDDNVVYLICYDTYVDIIYKKVQCETAEEPDAMGSAETE